MYEDSFSNFDKSIVGQPVVLKANYSLTVGPFRAGSGITFDEDKYLGTLTGYFTKEGEYYFVQIKFDKPIEGYNYGFSTTGSLNNYGSNQGLQAQNIVNELIENHKVILQNNLLCARGLEIMTDSGAGVPVDFKRRLYNLQAKLINRNTQLKNSGYVAEIQEGSHPQLSEYNQALVNFMNNPGVGFIISGTAIIIILCVVAAASAAIAYTVFKKMHAESKADFQLSNSLTNDLLKYLPKPVFDQLMAENEANRKAAQDAIDKAGSGGILNTLKYIAVGLIGFYAVDKFIINRN